jgi:hypothetical protein
MNNQVTIRVSENLTVNGQYIVNKEGYIVCFQSDFDHFKANNQFIQNQNNVPYTDSLGQGYNTNGVYIGMVTFETPYQNAQMKQYNKNIYTKLQNQVQNNNGINLGNTNNNTNNGINLGNTNNNGINLGNTNTNNNVGPNVNDLMGLVSPQTTPQVAPQNNNQIQQTASTIVGNNGSLQNNMGTAQNVTVTSVTNQANKPGIVGNVNNTPTAEEVKEFDFDINDPKTLPNYSTLLSTVEPEVDEILFLDARLSYTFYSKGHWREFLRKESKFSIPKHLEECFMSIVYMMFGEIESIGFKAFLNVATEEQLRELFLFIGDIINVTKTPGKYEYYMDFNLISCGTTIGDLLPKEFNGNKEITDIRAKKILIEQLKGKDLEKPSLMFYDNVVYFMCFKDDAIMLQRYLA